MQKDSKSITWEYVLPFMINWSQNGCSSLTTPKKCWYYIFKGPNVSHLFTMKK